MGNAAIRNAECSTKNGEMQHKFINFLNTHITQKLKKVDPKMTMLHKN
jgi:hypothetical protein